MPKIWLWEVFFLTTLALASTIVFWWTDLDVEIASFFYGINSTEPWAIDSIFWQDVYASAQWLSITVVVMGCAFIIMGFLRKDLKIWLRYGIFMVLGIAIGPGLLVNVVFKDHWGRPRPKALVEFGGSEYYVPPLKFNESGDGRSFPCGHASAGFSLVSLWFIRRDLKRGDDADKSFVKSIVLKVPQHAPLLLALAWGGILGWVRMKQGGHFLSDVLWSAYITFGVHYALWLWMFVRKSRQAVISGDYAEAAA
ncbi:MAG: phosphatase PAP2 family protein [Dissulfuribacterales bacterium]